MSTELYFSLEAKAGASGNWWHFARVRVSADYVLFALLAGVRADHPGVGAVQCLIPKGLPDDVTELTLEEDALEVDDAAASLDVPDTCRRADAEAWVADGASRFLHDGAAVTHPDFHSHSWLSRDEYAAVVERYAKMGGRDTPFARAVTAAMDALLAAGSECRAVFWFGG